jgi:hypothetical protein
MNSPQKPKAQDLADAVWAELGAVPAKDVRKNGAAVALATRLAWAGLVLFATTGVCVLLLVSGGNLIVTGIAGLIGVSLAGYFLTSHHPFRGLRAWGSPQPLPDRASGPRIAVIHTPAPDPPDPETLLLEERLLELCQQDRQLFARLLHFEQTRTPGERRVELLRLAIEHFERDKG